MYVFCHFHGPADAQAVTNPVDWDFYVLSTRAIVQKLGQQKTVGLTRLRTLTAPTVLEGLSDAVGQALAEAY